MLEITFITKPIGPVPLMVIISIKETTKEIASVAHGPSANPAITMATSLGSKERKPAKRIGITFPKFVSTYAKAQKTPIDVKFLVLLFILTSNKKIRPFRVDGEKEGRKALIIFSLSDLCQKTNTAGLGI